MGKTAKADIERTSHRPRPRRPQVVPPAPDSALDILAPKTSITAKLADLQAEYRTMLMTLDQSLHERIHQTGNEADAAAQNFENDQVLQLMNSRLERIALLERALGRIDDHHYGLCESCHRRIADARMDALPAATLCLSCKMAEEHY